MRQVIFPLALINYSRTLNDPTVAVALAILSPTFIDGACLFLSKDTSAMRDTSINLDFTLIKTILNFESLLSKVYFSYLKFLRIIFFFEFPIKWLLLRV